MNRLMSVLESLEKVSIPNDWLQEFDQLRILGINLILYSVKNNI